MSRLARVLSITSGKGGVGKTHTTINLGVALAKQGKRVLLLDADLGLANINVMLGFQTAATLHQVINGEAKLSEVIVPHPSGIDIIPAASGIPELTNLSEQERMALVSAVDDLGGQYDFMLVDTAAGIGDNVTYFNVAAEDIVVVVDPEPTSIADAYALVKVLSTQFSRKEFSVIVNRCPLLRDPRDTYAQLLSATDRFLQVRLKYLGSISHDQSVSEAILSQKPSIELFPGARSSIDITKIAQKIAEEERSPEIRGGVQFFLRSLLEASQAA